MHQLGILYILYIMVADSSNNKRFFNVLEVAKIIGLSRQTIVRYERKGIFPKPRRNLVNKWREYTDKDVSRLKSILGRM